jgi:Complex 1 protein (LYR family)
MSGVSKHQLLSLYKKLLRSAATFPSKNRKGIYKSIQEEWRANTTLTDQTRINKEIQLAFQGLNQLRQFDEASMTGGQVGSPNWNVTLDQNPMPKPPDYDERRAAKPKHS